MSLSLRKFAASEEGTMTISAVLWMPVFMMILSLITETSWLMNAQARAFQSASDVARSWATGGIATEADAKSKAQYLGTIRGVVPNAGNSSGTSDMVTVKVSYPVSQLDMFGFFGFMPNAEITVEVSHWRM